MRTSYLKGLLLAGITATFFACGGDTKPSTPEAPKPETAPAANETAASNAAPAGNFEKGKDVYKQTCQACHQENGQGLPNAFPPLASSDYLLADKGRAIKQVIFGSSGDITVNGTKFNGTMPPQGTALSDEQIADVVNYVLNSWGNNGGTVTVDEVKAQRK